MRNNTGKYMIVAALLVSVVALSLGFAAYTSTLTISSSAAVNGPGTNAFKVCFSKAANACTSGSVTPTLNPTTGGPTGANATINSATTTISGLKATFTAPGQTVTYSFKAYNSSSFVAYLNSVSLGAKTCTAKSGTSQSYVNAACNGISMSVKAGSATYNASNTNISSHSVASESAEDIIVTLTYAAGSSLADGDFDVAFGDTTLIYGTAD